MYVSACLSSITAESVPFITRSGQSGDLWALLPWTRIVASPGNLVVVSNSAGNLLNRDLVLGGKREAILSTGWRRVQGR